MELYKLETGNFKLDGGAIFGVVPKSIWNKVYPADENNLCNFPVRLLLIKDNKRLILIDAGIGNKQDEKFFGYYYLNETKTIENCLKETGYNKADITDVFLTHLHFDHCGGAIEINPKTKAFQPTFPNATYWCSRQQWKCAMHPNPREKSSFLEENIRPIKQSGKLNLFESSFHLTPDVEIRIYYGHTSGLSIPFINYRGKTLTFMGDLIPSAAHIPLSWICGYDTSPLVLFEEKKQFLDEALENKYTLFFEHDLYTECCDLKQTEKGIRKNNSFSLGDFIN